MCGKVNNSPNEDCLPEVIKKRRFGDGGDAGIYKRSRSQRERLWYYYN
jgi:hypothetical protein